MNIKILKIILGIIGTILLGAIGSGIWEKILSPVSDGFVENMALLLSNISGAFKDSIYTKLGLGSNQIIGIFTGTIYFTMNFLFVAVFVAMSIKLMTLIKSIRRIETPEKKPKEKRPLKKQDLLKKRKIWVWTTRIIVLPLVFVFAAFLFANTIRYAYRWDLVIEIERSIDIIAPYITDQELKEIRAEYRLIDDYESFELLENKIHIISTEHNVVLPKEK